MPHSSGIGQILGISNFQISGQTITNENCRNSRTSNDIDKKVEPVAKLDKKNAASFKKLDNDVMSANCDVIVFFPIYSQFAAIRKPDSGRKVYKTYIFINRNLLFYRNWKQN